jgi:AcrR family transcriptional regulator
MAARRRLKSEERRRQILEAAVSTFARHGFAGTTTRELARVSGVSQAMIFRFFPDKASLYRAIIDRYIAGAADLFPPASTRGGDRRILERAAADLIGNVEEDPTFVRLLLFSALEGHELSRLFLEARVLAVTRGLARYLGGRMRRGALRSVPPIVAARAFLGMAGNYALMNVLYGPALPGRLPRERVARLFTSLFLDGITATEAAAPRAKATAGAPSSGRRMASR